MTQVKAKFDVAQIMTDKIIALMEKGVCAWNRPWNLSEVPKNLTSMRAYRGFNTWLLRAEKIEKNYSTDFWLTAKQAIDIKGHVRKGEKSTPIIFWNISFLVKGKWYSSAKLKALGFGQAMVERKSFSLKYFNVFNADQCEGVSHKIPSPSEVTEIGSIAQLDEIESNWKDIPTINTGGDKAVYFPTRDSITLPNKEQFNGTAEFYATKWHELGHSTGHKSRLNRKELNDCAGFGSHSYSKEELTAELFSSSMMAIGGVTQTIDNSAAYIQSWMKALKNDKDLLIEASGRAQAAIDYVIRGGK